MKLHLDVDSQTGLTHSAVTTPANMQEHPLPQLLHGDEQTMYGDSAYSGQEALMHSKAPHAKDFTNQRTRKGGGVDEAECGKNRN